MRFVQEHPLLILKRRFRNIVVLIQRRFRNIVILTRAKKCNGAARVYGLEVYVNIVLAYSGHYFADFATVQAFFFVNDDDDFCSCNPRLASMSLAVLLLQLSASCDQ